MALYLVTVALTWLAPVHYIQKFFDPGTRIVKYGCWGFEVTLVSSLTSFHDSNLATVVWWATFIPIEDWSDLNHSVVNVVLGTHNCGILSMIKAHSFIYGYITTMVITLQQVQVKTSNSIKLVSTSPSSTLGNVPNWEMASHGEVRWELHTPYGSREGLTEDRSCGCKGLLKLKLWNLGAYLIKKKTGVLTSTTMVTVILLYQIGPVVAAPRGCKILYTRTNTLTFSFSTSSEATGLAWTPGTPRSVDGFHLKTEKHSSQLIF